MKVLLLLTCLLGTTLTYVVAKAEADTQDPFQDDFDTPDPVPIEGFKSSQIGQERSGSSQGSNYASHNQVCALDSEPGKRCRPNLGLVCDIRICKCQNSTVELDLVYTWSNNAGRCITIARQSDGWACEHDIQCHSSRLGRHSRCDSRSNTCECYDADGNGRQVVLVNDSCYLKKNIGDTCATDLECSSTIKGPAVCSGLRSAAVGICGCAGGHSFDKLLQECLAVGSSEESSCKSDRQCDDEKALGELARCNQDTGRCQCWDTKNNREFATDYYKLTKKCHYKRGANETCQYREECVLGYHRKADCVVHAAYNDAKVCQCPPGESCSGSGQVTFSILLVFITAFFASS